MNRIARSLPDRFFPILDFHSRLLIELFLNDRTFSSFFIKVIILIYKNYRDDSLINSKQKKSGGNCYRTFLLNQFIVLIHAEWLIYPNLKRRQ